MNEFAAKKMGEVLAFNRLSTETLEKGRAALSAVLGEQRILDMEEKNRMHGDAIVQIATEAGVVDTTNAKADATKLKLAQMRDMYIGDQWNNATEIFEWSGFFEGAAIVHWAVVKGVAQAVNNETLLTLSQEGITWHYELLELVESELESKGADRATA